MLELGKHSKKLHKSMGAIINRTKIDKVFVKGNNVLSIFNSILKSKRGRILNNNSQIIDFIKENAVKQPEPAPMFEKKNIEIER